MMMTKITLETVVQFVGLVVAMGGIYKGAVWAFGVNSRKIKKMQDQIDQLTTGSKRFELEIKELREKDEVFQGDIKILENDYKEIFKILLDRK